MMSRRFFLAVPSLALAIATSGVAMAAQPRASESDVIPGRYIVGFKHSAGSVSTETNGLERRLGFEADLRYRHALEGFSAELSHGQVRALRDRVDVDFVSPDRRVHAFDDVPLATGEPTPPAGIRRMLAATNATSREQSDANVAVIDTGIELSHPDLNAADGTNCVSPGSSANDDNGHGTHVAGTIAAKNDGSGVVGVAPGTTVYAVKVLNASGSGSFSQVVCGIDWVTAHASDLNIGVANMSLGGLGSPIRSCATTTDSMHAAICDSTDAGVTYVVAAGNSGWDFDYAPVPDVPAAYPQVLTVAALSDSDGEPGGIGGAPSCRPSEQDDRPASFSNYAATAAGEAHTIAAPGVCIRSTWPTTLGDLSGYVTISGTSMATPHVVGAVALCINEAGADGPCASKTPAEVIDYIRSEAQAYNTANAAFGFTNDPLHSPMAGRYYGFLSKAPPAADTGPIAPSNVSPPSISGTPRDGQTLSASPGGWSGTAPITYAYQWRRCDSNGASCTDIAGATGSSYGLGAADVGERLRVVVTAQNVAGSSSVTSESSGVVAAVRPRNSSVPVISGSPRQRALLMSSRGTWLGTQPIAYTYQWRRCKTTAGTCFDIPGGTGSAYEPTAADVGRQLRVVVTARNQGGSASARSLRTAVIAPTRGPAVSPLALRSPSFSRSR